MWRQRPDRHAASPRPTPSDSLCGLLRTRGVELTNRTNSASTGANRAGGSSAQRRARRTPQHDSNPPRVPRGQPGNPDGHDEASGEQENPRRLQRGGLGTNRSNWPLSQDLSPEAQLLRSKRGLVSGHAIVERADPELDAHAFAISKRPEKHPCSGLQMARPNAGCANESGCTHPWCPTPSVLRQGRPLPLTEAPAHDVGTTGRTRHTTTEQGDRQRRRLRCRRAEQNCGKPDLEGSPPAVATITGDRGRSGRDLISQPVASGRGPDLPRPGRRARRRGAPSTGCGPCPTPAWRGMRRTTLPTAGTGTARAGRRAWRA